MNEFKWIYPDVSIIISLIDDQRITFMNIAPYIFKKFLVVT